MEKKTKSQISLLCFGVGFILLLIQDLKGLSTINLGFAWPWAIMFYAGLLLMIVGYYPERVDPGQRVKGINSQVGASDPVKYPPR